MRPRALTRSARVVATGATLVGLVLSATSCDAGRPPAATVAGRDIPVERVDDLVAAFIEADPETYGSQLEGDGEDTYRMGAVSVILSNLVVQVAQSELAEREGAVPNESERGRAADLVRNSFAAGADAEVDPATGQPSPEAAQAQEASGKVFDALPSDTRDWLVDLRATTLALGRVAQDQQATAERTEDDPLCLRAIVVNEPDVAAVQQRLEDGEDFGAVSSEVTIDPSLAQSGGSLGQDCLTAAEYEAAGLEATFVEVIRELDFGEVSEPLELEEGVVALFEVRQDAEGALAALVAERIGDVDVDVDPRFGTWDAEIGQVVPPDGARPAETTGDELAPVTAPPAGG